MDHFVAVKLCSYKNKSRSLLVSCWEIILLISSCVQQSGKMKHYIFDFSWGYQTSKQNYQVMKVTIKQIPFGEQAEKRKICCVSLS